jgi:ABC-type glycerol-3-phosphate transport system permease component
MGKWSEISFQTINYTLFCLFAVICIYPFYFLFLVSVSDASAVSRGDVLLWPVGFHLTNFINVFQLNGIFSAFMISVGRTVIGTLLMLIFSCTLAYIVTKQELPGRKWIYRATVITIFFQAGLIPWVVTMNFLHLDNTFWLYVLPGIISPYAVILIKTYMESISPSLEESALIDGAGYFRILWSVMVPLSLPIIAAVSVFNAVTQWNSWQDNFFLVTDPQLKTLQLTLLEFLQQAELLARVIQSGNQDMNSIKNSMQFDPFAVKTTITMITVFPIMLFYPFMQKYFVKGIMLGAVKG